MAMDSEKAEVLNLEVSAQETPSGRSGDDVLDEKAEKRVRMKLDLVLLPLLSLSIFFGYLDRGQIGNARVLGMQTDLGLTNQQFYNCVMMFYVGYMLIELPAAMSLRYFHPRYVFGLALLAFGLFAAVIPPARSYGAIMTLRVLIGLGEAFTTNAYIFISLWYKPSELATRTAAIYGMTPIAGAISGIIAYGVGKNMENTSGLKAWEWLFVIEGVVSCAFGLVVMVLLPGIPEQTAAKGSYLFRSQEDQQAILRRFAKSQNSKNARLRPHQIWVAVKDPKLYTGSLMVGSAGVGIGAFGVFLPTFIREFGFSRLETQLYSMIPYAFGLVGLLFFSWLSDHLRQRALITIICLCITATGLIILMATTNKVALVAGACFVAGGAYPSLVVGVSWMLTFHGGYTKRATASWINQVFIQGYSIMATQVYRDAPRFFLGHGIALGVYAIAILSAIASWWICSRANQAKDQRQAELAAAGEVDPDMDEDYERLCDYHPGYRYAT